MELNAYRNNLIESISLLDNFQTQLFNSIVNIGMHGTFKDVNDSFETNDTFNFELTMFESTDDKNLDELLKLYKNVKACRQTILISNSIDENELEDNNDE